MPQDAVMDYGEKVTCFIGEGDRAVLHEIEISQPHNGLIMILSGVEVGDTLITIGGASLKSGQKIGLTLE